MRKVSVDRLKPGMKVGRSVINANGQVLLTHGIILNARFIEKLAQLGIPSIYIDDGFLSDIQINDVVSERTRYQVIEQTKQIFQGFQYTGNLSDLGKIEHAVDKLIKELLENDTLMVNLVDIRSLDEYTFGHSVNTCILSLITAIYMGYNEKKLRLLAMGAILHDLGKIHVPQEVLSKPGKLTNEEFNLIKKHPESGYRMLQTNKDFNPISAIVVLQHHERFNGSGYPKCLAGNLIHEFSSIVGIADVYDALTADRVYRKAYSPFEAYEMLAGTGDYLFDYKVIKAFLSHIAAYPVGSLVSLNYGATGVVLKNRPGYPLRPVVKVLFNDRNEPVPSPYELDLGIHLNYSIVKVIDDDNAISVLKGKI